MELLRYYLTEHPRADEPTAPLFPSMLLTPVKPAGKRTEDEGGQIANAADGQVLATDADTEPNASGEQTGNGTQSDLSPTMARGR